MENKEPNGPLSWEEAKKILESKVTFRGTITLGNYSCVGIPYEEAVKAIQESATSRVQALEEENKRLQERLSAAEEVIPIIRFLLGEAEFDGYYFGERHNKEIGTYWWRKYLRTFLEKYNSLKK